MSNSPIHPEDNSPDAAPEQPGASRVVRRQQKKAREAHHEAAASPKTAAAERVITVEIPPQTEFVRVARLAASGVASRMRFTYDQIEDIKLAISEACNNAILHARPVAGAQAQSSIVVRFWPHDDRLEISVEDGGHLPPGLPLLDFPHDNELENELALDDLPEGGMGLMLIQALMDEVQQAPHAPDETPSTTLRMTKRLRSS